MNQRQPKVFLLIFLIALSLAEPVAAGDDDFLEYYKAGLEAIEAKNWPLASELMQRAIRERSRESRRLPRFLYLKPYMPHYYLGLAEFNRDDCEAALQAWRVSLHYGVVQRRPQFRQIELAHEFCQSQRQSMPPPATPVVPPSEQPPPPRSPPAETVAPTPAPPPSPRRVRPSPQPESQRLPTEPSPAEAREVTQRRTEASRESPSNELLEAASALLDGSYQQVVDVLSAELPSELFSRAQARLLLAAAELALYQAGGERDAERLEKARIHVLEVRSVLPDLEPPERFYSPRFLDFYYGQRPQEGR